MTAADVERAKPLLGTNAISGRDYDQRAAGLAVAQAQLQVAAAAQKAAELNFEWTEVKAPIAGRISDKKVNEGNLVNGGAGQWAAACRGSRSAAPGYRASVKIPTPR